MNNWYELSKEEVLETLQTDEEKGLSSREIHDRQQRYGKNEFVKQKKESLGKTILKQLNDISTIILILAAVLSFALALRNGDGFLEPLVIVAIIIMNLILSISQERSAEKALEALSDLNSPTCLVLRDGSQQEIATAEVVPGDIIVLKTGSMVPSDARLIESTALFIDESALTGESEAAEKDQDATLEGKVGIGDQANMVFSGCLVTSGHGLAVVTSTGMETEMGKIAGYLNNKQKLKTPLQKRLDGVGKTISIIAIISAIFLLVLGMLQGEDFWSMMLLAVSLAVAAVPETLSLIVTLSLSNGVKKMVNKNAIIRKLQAVETLGNTSVICSDKTGTLTQNKMTIMRLWIPQEDAFDAEDEFSEKQKNFLTMLALASNADVEMNGDGSTRVIGDATETAIMNLMTKKDISKEEAEKTYKRVAEIPFSSDRKIMTAIVADPNGGYIVLTKGAIDRIPLKMNQEDEAFADVREMHDSFAADALRIIALGSKHIDELPKGEDLLSLEKDLELKGLIGLIDPIRPEAKAAVEVAKKAGIRTVMITGDHAKTAGAIASELGILGENERVITGAELSEMSDEDLCDSVHRYSVYARVSPEDKIRIVEAWQENGDVVAMTGDGVNDAPALKAADVGVAMGKAGTEVAKSAADVVLTDDNFATIIDAVEEGRNVYSNIRKTIYFLLVCNISEIIVMLISQMKGWGVAVTPVMLLLVNVLGDGIPGIHLAKETSDPRIMDRGPIKRNESFFGGTMLGAIIRQTIICSLVVLVGFYIGSFVTVGGLVPSMQIGQTLAFLILGWTSILHIFTVRSRKSIFKRTLKDNPALVVSAVGMIAVFALMVAVPSIGKIFGLTTLSGVHWWIAIGLSIVPTIVAEIGKLIDEHTRLREIRRNHHRKIKRRLRHEGDSI